jgi:hypothetical protein
VTTEAFAIIVPVDISNQIHTTSSKQEVMAAAVEITVTMAIA